MQSSAGPYQPTALDLDLHAQVLRITWADGVTGEFPLAVLRRHCPCAACRTEADQASGAGLRVLSPAQVQAASATVTGGHLVGNYAIQLDWSDGHNTGIFDFRLLRELHRRLLGDAPGDMLADS